MGPTISIHVQRVESGALITLAVGPKVEPARLEQLAAINPKAPPDLPAQVLQQKLVTDEQAEALLAALGL